MIIESKTMSNVFYSSEADTKIDFSTNCMKRMEKNVSKTCMIPIIYDGMYGIGDGTYMDVIPNWLGLVRPKIDCGKGVDELHEFTDDYENNPNRFVDIFDIVNSITFLVDDESMPYQCIIEFDRESIISRLNRYGIDVKPEDFTESMRVSYEFTAFDEGCEISEPEQW